MELERRLWRRNGGRLRSPPRNWLDSYDVCQTAQVLRLEHENLEQLARGKCGVSLSAIDVARRRQHLVELVPPAPARN